MEYFCITVWQNAWRLVKLIIHFSTPADLIHLNWASHKVFQIFKTATRVVSVILTSMCNFKDSVAVPKILQRWCTHLLMGESATQYGGISIGYDCTCALADFLVMI